ncbi:class I SAM-dependent methyltransferase [Thiomicrorhabdus aquaedulcis]|uniref:class I SAM-dependent methyltransferase n=1 Tax=Thiomicrorhabdus aquaedulcis TaxID=2211106 RepID=UPI000FDA148D|nr:class I SAM-dependent methyltransferase [Thiomicrorhabdus aquaedulcis]
MSEQKMRFEQADGILDLRDEIAYQTAHLLGATWLSWDDLPESLAMLPAAPAQFFLVGSKAQIDAASIFLDLKEYQVTGSLVVELDQSMALWDAQLPGLVVSGNDSKVLWSPNELVVRWLSKLEFDPKALKPRPLALDLGCGAGRDAVFLAQKGFVVDAIDSEARTLKRAKQLAARSRTQVRFKCCDLKNTECFPDQMYDVILMVRYLNRDLFDAIKQHVKPGGYVLIHTFSEGVEEFKSPKNPNFILQHGELRQIFAGFTILVDNTTYLNDGRPMNAFIAQKPLIE